MYCCSAVYISLSSRLFFAFGFARMQYKNNLTYVRTDKTVRLSERTKIHRDFSCPKKPRRYFPYYYIVFSLPCQCFLKDFHKVSAFFTALLPLFYQSFDKYADILSNASEREFILVAYERRRLYSPNFPNAVPGTTATFCAFSSPSANASAFMPVDFTEGKA